MARVRAGKEMDGDGVMDDEAVLQQRLWRLKDEHSRTTDNPTRRVFLERRIMEVLERLERMPLEMHK